MNETINPPMNRLGRAVAAGLGVRLTSATRAAPAGAETYQNGFKGRTPEASFYTQQGRTATETVVHAVEGRVKVGAGRPDAHSTLFAGVLCLDELVDSESVEGDRLHSLIAAVASSGDKRLRDDLASPLPRPSAASYPQLSALAS